MGLSDDELTKKDTAESPRSERETRRMQHETPDESAAADDGVDTDRVKLLPGTGGPDDSGDVDPREVDGRSVLPDTPHGQ